MGLGQVQVIGAKIVAPDRDTVGLVDYQACYAAPAQGVDKGQLAQSLGGNVDETVLAGGDAFDDAAQIVAVEAAVDGHGLAAQGSGEAVDLVFHQGNERRDDEGNPFSREGGQLVAERLTGAGGHDGQDMFAALDAGKDFGLAGEELRVAEHTLGGGFQFVALLGGDGH